ncbi:ABC transporter permease [Streptosporangiaceae bacterium NEAU-GS5]|nr:ABC transporter permease [Streptosporangiaceae bacterium NEAU-GS5]
MTAILAGVSRRRLTAVVVALVVLASGTASVLGLGLLAASDAPFDHAFAQQSGAHAVAAFDPSKVPATGLAMRGASGPFPQATVRPTIDGFRLSPMTVVGRADPLGPVDKVSVDEGRWVRGPGEIVLNREFAGPRLAGATLTVDGRPLRVVGVAYSVSRTADAWVSPQDLPHPQSLQMLYRFAQAATEDQVRAGMIAVTRGLPTGALIGSRSYLSVRLSANGAIAPIVPFLVAFAVLGVVMSVLIVVNVVSGSVVAGYFRIGMLKSLGFTPGQVVAAHVVQVLLPAALGVTLGALLGNLLSVPLLEDAAQVYGTGALTVAPWIDVVVPAGLLTLVALAALVPALRAGRLSAIEAITTGRAPRAEHGRAAQRLLGGLRLPRAVTLGLARPFARPARAATMLAAVLFGATTITFALGLGSSLYLIEDALLHDRSAPLEVAMMRGPDAVPYDGSLLKTIKDQPGTAHVVGIDRRDVTIPGLSGSLPMTVFDGDVSWTGRQLISGRWFRTPDEVVVPTGLLNSMALSVGDSTALEQDGARRTVHIVGEIFETDDAGLQVFALDPAATATRYEVALTPGTDLETYRNTLQTALQGRPIDVSLNDENGRRLFSILLGMISTLTVLLAVVAGLGVFNAVVLDTRERVHDLGVLKAIGMEPRQTIAMVIAGVAGLGLLAGLVALPAGLALHRWILPVMAAAAGTGLPPGDLDVYTWDRLTILAASGLTIAILGALIPATWAARTHPAPALRTE